MLRRAASLGLCLAVMSGGTVGAQRVRPTLASIGRSNELPMAALPGHTTVGGRWGFDDIPVWSAPLASALVPGVGQAMEHQQRFVVYLAVEGFVWLQYFKDQHDYRQQRAAYRDLAATVARSPFTASPPVGGWDYYERMEEFVESGVYSLNGSTTNVLPETDTTTYNGAMWLLARRNFWQNPTITPPANSPQYQEALQFYESRAAGPAYQWSWRNAQLEQDLYRRIINKANDAVRRTTSDLGVLLANHVLSAVDAFAVLQVRVQTGPTGDPELVWRVPVPFR